MFYLKSLFVGLDEFLGQDVRGIIMERDWIPILIWEGKESVHKIQGKVKLWEIGGVAFLSY